MGCLTLNASKVSSGIAVTATAVAASALSVSATKVGDIDVSTENRNDPFTITADRKVWEGGVTAANVNKGISVNVGLICRVGSDWVRFFVDNSRPLMVFDEYFLVRRNGI